MSTMTHTSSSRIVGTVWAWLALAFPLAALSQNVELAPGLVAEYFTFNESLDDFPEIPAGRQPTFVRVERRVRYNAVPGDFYGTALTRNFYARWTGVLRTKSPGVYRFRLISNDGSRLWIDEMLVVNHGGQHEMTEKWGSIELEAGHHPLRIDLFQGTGQVGIRFEWMPPDGSDRPNRPNRPNRIATWVPEDVLFHKKGSENIPWDRQAWEKRRASTRPPEGQGRYAQMDHGPFFSGTIDTLFPTRESYTNKGIVIRLRRDPPAALCFDTELIKVSAGWTGGFLGWPQGRDGIEGEPFPTGVLKFGTKPESLGWAQGDAFDDPRHIPYGPLPRDWARYRGLYRHGERVVLSYSVGDGMILEMPALETAGDLEVFTRTLEVGSHASPLTMLVCEASGTARRIGETVAVETSESVTAVGLVTAPRGCALRVGEGGRVELVIPASKARVRIKLAIWNGAPADLTLFQSGMKKCPPAIDVTPLLAGGPSLWLPVLETKAAMGRGPGPYVVDTITVPYENPWKAYMRLSAFDFFPDSRRAAVATFDGDVWIVSGVGGTLSEITWKRYATGLFQPLGLRIVRGSMYVLGRDQITRLHDLNGDDEADYYENFNNGCMVAPNFHEFAMNLLTDAEGNFYYGKSASWPPNIKTDHEGTLLKVSRDGSKFEVFATGVRNPNGMSISPDGRLAVTDNEGHWMPACWVGFARQGDYLGMITTAHRSPVPTDYVKPITYLPRDLDNSTGGVVWVTSDRWGPLQDQLLVLSYGKCSLFQVLIDEVEGQVQGGVIRFPLQFNTGIIRARISLDIYSTIHRLASSP